MSPEMKSNLSIVCAEVEKRYGKGAVMKLNEPVVFQPDDAIDTGSIALNLALGIGGYRKGRIVEIFGQESCLAYNTHIPYINEKDGSDSNHKGGTIRRLYERFHNVDDGGSRQGRHLQDLESEYYVLSVDDSDRVIRNRVLDVVKTGLKKCYKLSTSDGQTLTSTAEHKYQTPNGYVALSDLKIGDEVFVHNNTRVKGRKKSPNRPDVMVKYHPNWPSKIVHCDKVNKDYLYFRGQKSRAVYEAFLNNISFNEYIEILNTESKSNIKELNFLPDDIHVHHLDENFNNNSLDNLVLVDPSEHGKLHAKDRIRNLSFITVPVKIQEIVEAGDMETYDIKCAFPYNNYIANGIVVHNSGKTTLCLHACASIQKLGKECLFIDAEHSFDPTYAQALGVDLDRLLICQPDNGEQALEIANLFVRSGELGLIIIDSVAALVPQKELEGEIGDASVGTQARMMSQACRMLVGNAATTGTTIIFTNQIRMKIGVMHGSPKTTSGGNALKFYASQRLEIARTGDLTKGEDIIGNKSIVTVVKNKVAPPKKKAEFNIIFGRGVDNDGEIIELAASDGIIKKSGSWFSYEGNNIAQGGANAVRWLNEHPEIKADIKKQILEARGLI